MERALERQLPDAAHLWSGLISERSRAGAWQTSLALLGAAGAGRSAADLSGVLGACARRRQWRWAVRLWEEARGGRGEGGVDRLDEQSYAAAARAFSDGQLWEGALSLLRDSQERGVPQSTGLYNEVAMACARARRW